MSNDVNTQAPNPIQMAEQITDTLWHLTQDWNDFAKSTVAHPWLQAMDSAALQLAFTLGRTTVKQHMQHLSNARKGLVPVDYYLQRALKCGLIEQPQADELHAQLTALAQRLDQHAQTVVQSANQKVAEQETKAEENRKEETISEGSSDAATAAAH
ncbi:MAG: four helix bundle protein [Chromatiales bacterium]|nr:four helix bundle protein [Chromatiales bacterium]